MPQYLAWNRNGRSRDAYVKPRSLSLDAKSLEKSGIKLLLQQVQFYAIVFCTFYILN